MPLQSTCPSSPRTRGWSHGGEQQRGQRPVVPADAGVVPCPRRARRPRCGRPRGRGGGPRDTVHRQCGCPSSPRTRGWSRDRAPRGLRLRVVPADAGVVPTWCTGGTRAARRPRGRGGGPTTSSPGVTASKSSPRTRGWSHHHDHEISGSIVVPADAGVVPAATRGPSRLRGRPRGRGGGPPVTGCTKVSPGSSPRTRGWSLRSTRTGRCPRSRPRGRGGGPAAKGIPDAARRSSPRTRGWSPPLDDGPVQPDVVPADAGVVPSSARRRRSGPGRPRGRGGGPRRGETMTAKVLSSPRTRGWSSARARGPARRAVVPADAGVVPSTASTYSPSRRRPRGRGGGPASAEGIPVGVRSSPRTRGWSQAGSVVGLVRHVVPADAGVVPRSARRWSSSTGRPRGRGVVPAAAAIVEHYSGRPRGRGGGPASTRAAPAPCRSSPRTRGWSLPAGPGQLVDGVVPADAGVVLRAPTSTNAP